MTENAKETARAAVEDHLADLLALSRAVHDDPELCFEEHHAAQAVSQALSRGGLEVETGVCGLPTAVRATTGTGPLSVVVCAEYDALAGVGHACGHNLIAAAAVGAGIGLAAVTGQVGLKVTVLGTPAEEGGGGKIFLLEGGAFAGAHAAMMVHPWHENRLGARCLAVDHLEVRYTGREAHAASSPQKGVNAGDAMVVAQVAIGLLRQHLEPGDLVHGIVVEGGDAANVVPKQTIGHFMVRAPTLEALATLRPRIEHCFEAGALATGCTLAIRPLSPTYSDYVADEPLLAAWRSNAESLGRQFPADDDGEPLPVVSTDMANVSRAVPTIHPFLGLEAGGAMVHQPAFAEAALGPSAEQLVVDGALSIAFTAIDAASDPDLRRHLLGAAVV